MPSESTSAERRSPAPSSARPGRSCDSRRRSTPAGDPVAIVDIVVDLIHALGEGEDVVAAGVAAAGFIDATQSIVYYAPNINWRSEPFRAAPVASCCPASTSRSTTTPTPRAGPSTASAAGRGATDMTLLTIGTGVGGAVVADGRLLRGGFGAAGEIGHLRVVPGGLPCGCGAARLHRAVRLRPRAAALRQRDRGCRRHRPEPRRGPRGQRGELDGDDRRRAHRGSRSRRPRRPARARVVARPGLRIHRRRARPAALRVRRGSRGRGRAAARADPRGVPRAPAGARVPPRADVLDRRAGQRRRRRRRRRSRPRARRGESTAPAR